jgi:hypothetical protein
VTARRAPAAAAALLGAALLAGCGGGAGTGPVTTTTPAAAAADYFVGTGGDGTGASVDLRATDRVTAELRRALSRGPGDPPDIGVAAILNDAATVRPTPSFVAVLRDGRTLPLLPARRVLGARDDPAARRARALLPPPGALAPQAAVSLYLVLESASVGDVQGVRMITASGERVTLSPQAR